jgi:hypothetical protein
MLNMGTGLENITLFPIFAVNENIQRIYKQSFRTYNDRSNLAAIITCVWT